MIGENFIHVHLKSEARRITERDIKNASLLITQNLGVKTEGKEVYLRVSNGIFSFVQYIFFKFVLFVVLRTGRE